MATRSIKSEKLQQIKGIQRVQSRALTCVSRLCKLVFNDNVNAISTVFYDNVNAISRISTRSYENLSVLKLVKTAINTAITVKLLKSKLLKWHWVHAKTWKWIVKQQVGNLSEHARAKWATQLRGIHAMRAYNCVNIAKFSVQNKWLFHVENGHDLN
jgi:hypothetical protein